MQGKFVLVIVQGIATKNILLLVLIALSALASRAQNSDCATATSVCNATYTESNSPTGTGDVFELAPGSCQSGGEFNSAWYVFSPQEDGIFSFILQPNSDFDDYDWSLFNISDNGCQGINTGASPEISCNSYGTFDFQGPTGISTNEGGIGNSNGPGDLSGPPFNADINVGAGNIYALVVMNYSATLNGYTLDFGTGAASIYDIVPPALTSLQNNWCTGEIVLNFSEGIDVSILQASDFLIAEPGYSIVSFNSENSSQDNTITLGLNQNTLSDNITLTLNMANGSSLSDICGNTVAMPLSLPLIGDFEIEAIATRACNGDNATLDVLLTDNAAIPPYSFSVNGIIQNSFPMQDVAVGNVQIVVEDSLGCMQQTNLSIQNDVAQITLPHDTTLCSLSSTFAAVVNAQNFSWEMLSGIGFSAPTSPVSVLSAASPGQYEIFANALTNTCSVSDSFLVTFNYPPLLNIESTDASCFGFCNGSLQLVNGNPAIISAIFENQNLSGNTILFENICAGNYNLTVNHSANCSADYTFDINEPAELSARFTASSLEVPLANPFIQLISLTQNADSVRWELTSLDDFSSIDSIWNVNLPAVSGVYPLRFTAYLGENCSDFVEANLIVQDEFYLYLPNTFTPNGDDINDQFAAHFSFEPLEYQLTIFNRFGETVFKSDDANEVWTGNMLGGEYFCPNGIYNWQLKLRSREVDEYTYQGFLTLIR